MLKRPAAEQQAPPSKSRASGHGERPNSRHQSDTNPSNPMGEFEDPWDDEVESDENVVDKQDREDEADQNGESEFSLHVPMGVIVTAEDQTWRLMKFCRQLRRKTSHHLSQTHIFLAITSYQKMRSSNRIIQYMLHCIQ